LPEVALLVVQVGKVTVEDAPGMESLATAVALLVAEEIPFDVFAVNPWAFPPLPEKLSVGMVVVASFCITIDTAISLGFAVTNPAGVRLLAPDAEVLVASATSNGAEAFTFPKATTSAVNPVPAFDGEVTETLVSPPSNL
jgi:hypothetical protein